MQIHKANGEQLSTTCVSISGGKDGGTKKATHMGESGSTEVTVELSEQGKQLSQTEKNQLLQAEKDQLQEQLESAQDAGDGMKDMAKLMLIARRIANGDRVPPLDEQRLMEFDRELYMAAKAAAVLHQDKKPKVYDSVFTDDEDSDRREQLRSV